MAARDQIARVLSDIPSGLVRRASDPAEALPRLTSGSAALDSLLGGGWPRGRICLIGAGGTSSRGRTSLAVMTVAAAAQRGLLCAWIDASASLDPLSLEQAGADTERVLWVRGALGFGRAMSASEEVVRTGGFEVVVIRVPGRARRRGPSRGGNRTAAWLRLSRSVERGRVVLLALDDDGGAAIPGCVSLSLSGHRVDWAGSPGVSDLLLGVGARVSTAEGRASMELVSNPDYL